MTGIPGVDGGIDLRLQHGSVGHRDQNARRLGRNGLLQLGQLGLRIVGLRPHHPGRHLVLRRRLFEAGRRGLPVGQRRIAPKSGSKPLCSSACRCTRT